MTNAEKMKKYLENIKKDEVRYKALKEKTRNRNNSIRKKLTGTRLAEFRANNRDRQRKFRENRRNSIMNKSSVSSFKSRQSFSESLKKVKSALPKCDKKKESFDSTSC